jgi:signal peptidase II
MLKYLLIAIAVIALDRYSKGWMINHLNPYQPLEIFPVLNFTLSFNTGAAFSFLHSASGWQNILFSGLALLVSLLIIFWLATLSPRERWKGVALSLVLGGAVGNAWDRFAFGYVIDFINFHINDWHFAIFNVADSAICIGAFMLIVQWMRQSKRL